MVDLKPAPLHLNKETKTKRHFADEIFKCIFWYEMFFILNKLFDVYSEGSNSLVYNDFFLAVSSLDNVN